MRAFFQEIILLVLFATPLGYLLNLLKIIQTQENNSISITINGDKPLNVSVKTLPTNRERVRWITYGLLLMTQALIPLFFANKVTNSSAIKFMGAFVWMTMLLGITTLVSGILPNFPWNKRPFGISVFEVIFFISAFVTLGILIYK